MRTWIKVGLALAAGAGLAGPAARAQVVERDTKVTGPRGRTIERQVRTQRGPGYIDREVDIRRPAGEVRRDTIIRAGPGPGGGGGPRPWVGGGGGYGPRGFGYGGPVFVERNVFVAPPPRPAGFFGIGLPFFGLSVGAPAFAPPPVVVAPPPIIVAPQPPVVVAGGQPYPGQPGPPAQQPVAVADPLTVPLSQLQSFHSVNRRDGCLAIGRTGDPRGVPALMDRLKNDGDKDVRIAAAWALGEIGDPRAGVYLERAALFDKKQEVRDAAANAYKRLPPEGAAVQVAPPANAGPINAGPADAAPIFQPPADAGSPPPPAFDPNTPPPPPTPAEGQGP